MHSLNGGDVSYDDADSVVDIVPSGFVEPLSIEHSAYTTHLVCRKHIRRYRGVLCTTSSIVYDESVCRWRYVSELEDATAVWEDDELVTVYNYVIKGGVLKVGDVEYRDFMETSDTRVYDEYHSAART